MEQPPEITTQQHDRWTVNVGTSIQSGLSVLAKRPASVLPVYLLVAGLTATTRVPILLGIAATVAILAADGRLDTLISELEAVDFEAIANAPPEAAADSVPAGLQQAVVDLFTPEIVALLGIAAAATVVVSVLANGIGNAAAINGIYGCLYGGDGVVDAVVGVGRNWKPFVGLVVARIGILVVGAVPLALGAGVFAISPVAGTAATLVGGLLSTAIIIGGLLALAFAGQSVVVDGVGFGRAVRRSIGFPRRRPVPFLAYIVMALAIFGGLGVLGGVFGFLGVSQLSGIIGPLVAIPFFDAFKTALYADQPFSPTSADGQIAPIETAEATDGGHPTDTTADQPPYRHRIVAAFREGLAALGGFIRGYPVPILAASTLFGLAAIGGWQLTGEFALDLPATEDATEVFGTVPVDVFVMIAANNWLVSATAIYGGVALGVPTAVDMLLNGFIVGAVYGVVDPLAFVALVAPHGIIELPMIITAGGLGFHLAAVVDGTLRGTRTSTELAEELRRAYRVLLGLAVVLVIASFIEAFITPRIAGLVLA